MDSIYVLLSECVWLYCIFRSTVLLIVLESTRERSHRFAGFLLINYA